MDMVTKHVGWQGSLVDTVRELCRRVEGTEIQVPPVYLAGSKDEPVDNNATWVPAFQKPDMCPRESDYFQPNPCPTCSHDDDGTCLRTGEAHGRVYECSSYRARGDHGDPR
jgi:hypothetical protein